MKKFPLLTVALSTLLTFSAARATTVIPPTFDELVSEAELIFQGTVTDVKSQWNGEGAQRHIDSYITVKVEDAIKGEPGPTYTMRMLGGTVGDETLEVSDSPKFKVGDRDILFVEHNGTQFIPLVGIMHGRFRVAQDRATGAETVLADNGKAVTDVAKIGVEQQPNANKNSATNAPEQPLDTAAFKAAIRNKLGAQ